MGINSGLKGLISLHGLLTSGTEPRYPLHRKLRVPQSRLDASENRKNPLSLPAFQKTSSPRLPKQWITKTPFIGVRWLGRDSNYSPPSSVQAQEFVEQYISPLYTFLFRCLIKHGEKSTHTC